MLQICATAYRPLKRKLVLARCLPVIQSTVSEDHSTTDLPLIFRVNLFAFVCAGPTSIACVTAEPDGNGMWKVRYVPTEVGEYTVTLLWNDVPVACECFKQDKHYSHSLFIWHCLQREIISVTELGVSV